MPHGTVIPAKFDAPLQAHEFNALADYQAAVGGYIEPVDVHELGATLYVNEEGCLRSYRSTRVPPCFGGVGAQR